MKEIPSAQKDAELFTSEKCPRGVSGFLEMVCERGGIKSSITCAADLGAGRGLIARGLLEQFPQAAIHAFDYWDILPQNMRVHPRVFFHQGFLIKSLDSCRGISPYLTILNFIGDKHGFNAANINLLQKFVDAGILITQGDNNWLGSNTWFRKVFELIPGSFVREYLIEDTYLWRART